MKSLKHSFYTALAACFALGIDPAPSPQTTGVPEVVPAGEKNSILLSPRPLVADVDTGRDDAWKLIGALTLGRLSAVVSSYGNVPLEKATRNTVDVIHLFHEARQEKGDPSSPAFRIWTGASSPLAPATPQAATEIARRAATGGNGLCNIIIPSGEDSDHVEAHEGLAGIVSYIREKGPVDYTASGPMTNLAALVGLLGEDEAREKIGRVIVMGGSIAPSLAVDFNFRADPRAAEKIIRVFGEKLVMVPFDETKKMHLTLDEIRELTPDNMLGVFCRDLLEAHAKGWSPDQSAMLHDPSCLLALERLCPEETISVSVVQSGDNAGKVVIDDQNGTRIRKIRIPDGQEKNIRDIVLGRYMHLAPRAPAP